MESTAAEPEPESPGADECVHGLAAWGSQGFGR